MKNNNEALVAFKKFALVFAQAIREHGINWDKVYAVDPGVADDLCYDGDRVYVALETIKNTLKLFEKASKAAAKIGKQKK